MTAKSNLKVLGKIKPYTIGSKLIIAIDSRWSDVFDSENTSFNVVINDNKIMLIGPKVSHQSPTTKSTAAKQEISDFD